MKNSTCGKQSESHTGNTLFCRAVMLILNRWLLHKRRIQGSLDSSSSRSISVKTALTLTKKFVCHNIDGAQGKQSLHLRQDHISTFTEFTWRRRTLTNQSDVKIRISMVSLEVAWRYFSQLITSFSARRNSVGRWPFVRTQNLSPIDT